MGQPGEQRIRSEEGALQTLEEENRAFFAAKAKMVQSAMSATRAMRGAQAMRAARMGLEAEGASFLSSRARPKGGGGANKEAGEGTEWTPVTAMGS